MPKIDSNIEPTEVPNIYSTDKIYQSRSAFVIPEYKLIFFTFPKVACSEWKRMFMRMNGNPNWCRIRGFNAHDPKNNKIPILADYPVEIATAMMTSPAWTRAAIVREPKERVLSAFLDKAIKEEYFVRRCCKKLPTDEYKEECVQSHKNFESFLYYIKSFPKECFDVHWEPQSTKVDAKWWPYINFIGYQSNLREDSKELLQNLASTQSLFGQDSTAIDNNDSGRINGIVSAWDQFGKTGWGDEYGCENRTKSFLEENTSTHKLGTGNRLKEWYTKNLEKVVEEQFHVEWQYLDFPPTKLF